MSSRHKTHSVLPKNPVAAERAGTPSPPATTSLLELAAMNMDAIFARLHSSSRGLTEVEASRRLIDHGPNALTQDRHLSLLRLIGHAVFNPLVILLAVLASVSLVTGDLKAASVMFLMITLGVSLKLVQEGKADRAVARLKALISVRASVLRDAELCELPVTRLVPGDMIHLAAGDMVPGDVRICQAKDLFVRQAMLSGESLPVEKHAREEAQGASSALELTSIAFLGTSVESGSATALVVATGNDTFLGHMAASLSAPTQPTAFDRGVTRFTWLMLRLMLVMVPLVFLINGLTRGDWQQAFFFALAVAVGLTPEMLPMVVTVCLSRGAIAMSRKHVIVKRLHAIQNLGAMDILCTDKTGTLTMDEVSLERYCDVSLRDDDEVLLLAYLNSHFQTGLKSVLDRAVLAHEETHAHTLIADSIKVDEIPFDFERRIMSVVVRTAEGGERLVCKGAPEAVFPRCASFALDGERLPMDHEHIEKLALEYQRLSGEGFRVLAIACKDLPARPEGTQASYSTSDEQNLVLRGYVAFFDPPKESSAQAIASLEGLGVQVKVITGDNDKVARKVCQQVGLATEVVLLGAQVEAMNDEALRIAAERATLFARVSPAHKERIIRALQAGHHTVGFLGDGINDAPALRAADVSISVDSATDIAKEAADMILMERSLLVLVDGVREGRKVFANILKYVKMGASSNLGNVLSVVGASIFVPFLPMLPIQILANNLLYDLSQTAIPSDEVDEDQLRKPRPWDIAQLTRFITCIGPCSSLFDYSTFLVMLYLFGCWNTSSPDAAAASASLFQSGWFVESLLTQTLVIHVIRTNKIPFLQTRASWQLMAMGLVAVALGVALPYSPLGPSLGFRPLPALFWPIIVFTLICYVLLTQAVKMWLLRRRWL